MGDLTDRMNAKMDADLAQGHGGSASQGERPFTITPVFRRTEHLRWRISHVDSVPVQTLEQAWLDVATGAVEWRRLPVVTGETPEDAR